MTQATAADGAIPLRRTATDVAGLLQSIQQVMAPQAKVFDVTLRVAIDTRVPPTLFVDRRRIAWPG